MEPQALTSTPDRSLAQRMQALAHGNDVRLKRAQFKRDLKAGRVSIIDAITAPPWWLETAKLYDLLLAVPRYGRVKVNKVFKIVGISPVKRLAGITARQRADLLIVLGGGTIPSRAGSVPSRAQIVHSLPEAPVPEPTTFQRRVLAAVLDYGQINDHNILSVAHALSSNPSSVTRTCDDLKRMLLMDAAGRPTAAGRVRSSVLPATPVAA